MKKTGEIANIINAANHDIKAEVLIADLMENGLSPEDFVVIPTGSFRRRFSSDIKKAETLRLNNNQQLLTVQINRDGIYDSLPEGLFHTAPDQPFRESTEMSQDSKKMRLEEKESRAFFVPFENEIFLQRTALETGERKILNRFRESLFDEIFPEFWNLDKSLNPLFVAGLVQLLHFAHWIAGNPTLTARSLELIIGERVRVHVVPSGKSKESEKKDAVDNILLGSARLGMDFVCGSRFDDLLPAMEFVIGPLQQGRIHDFLETGDTTKFLNVFYNYFLPVGTDVKTTVLISGEQQGFVLSGREFAPSLGYDTTI